MTKTTDITIPDLGDFSDVEVIEVLVEPGAELAAEDGIITLETDKATMDVPAPGPGTLVSISVAVGDTVNSGDVIGTLSTAGDAPVPEPPAGEDKAFAETEVLEDGDTVIRQAAAAMPGKADVTVVVPDLGDFADVEVIDVLVATGDSVEVEQGLVTLETDKATMDVPSTAAGTVTDVRVAVGARVNPGDPLAVIAGGAAAAETPAAAASAAPAAAPEAPAAEPATAPAEPTAPPGARAAGQRVCAIADD